MKKKEPRLLKDILTNESNSLFSRLTHQRTDNDTLLSRIRALLAPKIAQHLVAATYREDIVVLVADSAAWANRLRFESEHLRKNLINAGYFAEPYPQQPDASQHEQRAKPCLAKIVTRTAADNIGQA